MSDEQERLPRRVRPMTETARRLRRRATPAERALWEIVRARRCHGWRFVRQGVVGQYLLDFYCPAARLAIEVDGGIHDTPSAQAHDAARQQAIEEELCIRFLRLTNEELLHAPPDQLAARIDAAARAAQAVVPPPGERPARRQ